MRRTDLSRIAATVHRVAGGASVAEVREGQAGGVLIELRHGGRTVVVENAHGLWRVSVGSPASGESTPPRALFATLEEALAVAAHLLHEEEHGPGRAAEPASRLRPDPPSRPPPPVAARNPRRRPPGPSRFR
ncbi:hypothetical protein [Streptomyces olivaceiscleroticus]|uniref:Uncharacterized protein n=1 Tax=Streptomyces olivaceiscleroticus TaxID=68245 RepID=A0ABP3KWS3_9ACTN